MRFYHVIALIAFLAVAVLYAVAGNAVLATIWGFSSGIWFSMVLNDIFGGAWSK